MVWRNQLRITNPVDEFLLQKFLGRQVELILFGVDVRTCRKSQLDDGVLLPFAEKDADGWIFLGQLHMAVEV